MLLHERAEHAPPESRSGTGIDRKATPAEPLLRTTN
jgi:hypothetical protein